MSYSREEQETVLVFNNATGEWTVYSNVAKHIRRLQKIGEFEIIESKGDRPIAIKGRLNEKQVSLRQERVLTEKQKLEMAKRLVKARSKKLTNNK